MAWDHTKNHEAVVGGGRMEWGKATLSGGTVEVPTHLKACESAVATYAEAPGADTQLTCDRTITNGAITIQDAGGADKEINYQFLGH